MPGLAADWNSAGENWMRMPCATIRPILFGLETALRHLLTGSWALYDTDFSQGKAGIPINGLIWMGDFDTMLSRIEEKMAAGFRCIKLKIGAIGFEDELLCFAISVHISLPGR